MTQPGSLIAPSLIAPVLAHIAWVAMLYAWLTLARLRAVQSGRARFATYEFGRDEPPAIARITRNLANQFELPVIAYACIILLLQIGAANAWDVAFAWLFFAGRIIHTAVQTLTANVPLRGAVFTLNAAACAALAIHLGLAVL